MNIAICEDCSADSTLLCRYITEFCEKNCYSVEIFKFEKGEDLLAAFSPGLFHLIILDIFLPGISGMDVAKKIRALDPDCILIFITVSIDYALDGYAVQALSYLVKPFDFVKINKTLLMCKQLFAENSRFIQVVSNYKNIEIPLNNIQYVEVFGKVSLIHLNTGDIQTYMPLDEIEQISGGYPFLRCHRSYLVNMKYVERIHKNDLIMRNGDSVPIRKSGRAEIWLTMSRFMTGNISSGEAL